MDRMHNTGSTYLPPHDAESLGDVRQQQAFLAGMCLRHYFGARLLPDPREAHGLEPQAEEAGRASSAHVLWSATKRAHARAASFAGSSASSPARRLQPGVRSWPGASGSQAAVFPLGASPPSPTSSFSRSPLSFFGQTRPDTHRVHFASVGAHRPKPRKAAVKQAVPEQDDGARQIPPRTLGRGFFGWLASKKRAWYQGRSKQVHPVLKLGA
jgi:hypothetical protein